MTVGDGDAEQLRVPRWLAQSGSSEGGPGYGSDDPEPADDPDRDDPDDDDPDDDDPDRDLNGRDADDFDARIYVPRRYSPEADDDPDAHDPNSYDPDTDDPDFDDIEYPARPSRRAAWKDTLPGNNRFGADRLGADDVDSGDDGRPRGRRHAATPRSRRLVVAWIAAAVVIAVALPVGVLLYSSGNGTNVGAGGQRTVSPPQTDAQPSVDGVSIPGSQPETGAPGQAEPTARSNAAPNPGQFGPVTYEAEANGNVLSGSASVVAYPGASGGSIVRNIGDWGIGGGPGTLRFQNVDVPAAGSYTLTFFHVNIDNERVRTAVVTVDGVNPVLVTITGSANCCLSTTIRLTLKQGRNSITFSNNSAHAPSIDKITISQP